MARVVVYRAHDWHELVAYRSAWLGTHPAVLIVPDDEVKSRVAEAFSDRNVRAVRTLPELVEQFVRACGHRGFVPPEGRRALLNDILSSQGAGYLNIQTRKQGYARALAEFIEHYRCTVVEDLRSAIARLKGSASFSFKEGELIRIHDEYEERLAEFGFDVRRGLLQLLRYLEGGGRLDGAERPGGVGSRRGVSAAAAPEAAGSTGAAETAAPEGEAGWAAPLGIDSGDLLVFAGFRYLRPLEAELLSALARRVAAGAMPDPSGSGTGSPEAVGNAGDRPEAGRDPRDTGDSGHGGWSGGSTGDAGDSGDGGGSGGSGPNAAILVARDPHAPEQALRVQESVERLLERLDGLVEERVLGSCEAPEASQPEDAFVALSNAVFRSETTCRGPEGGPADVIGSAGATDGEPGADRFVRVQRYDERYAEVTAIARQIRRVVAPDYERYSSIVDEVFPRYGVSYRLERGVPLLRYPLASLVRAVVQQIALPNPYALHESILASPYTCFRDRVGATELAALQESKGVELVPAHRLNELLPEPTESELDLSYVKRVRDRAYRAAGSGCDLPQAEIVRRYIAKLDGLSDSEREAASLEALTGLYLESRAVRELQRWSSRMSAGAFCDRVQEVLRRFRVPECVEACPDTEIRARDRAILGAVSEISARMPSDVAPMLGDEGSELPLSRLVRLFSAAMEEATFRVGDPETDSVSVASPEGTQYRRHGYTFVCGLVDGEFPAGESYSFLQPRKDGLGLGSAYTTVDHGRYRFHQLVRSTERRLVLTVPRAENGKRLAESPFVGDIERGAAVVRGIPAGPEAGDAAPEEAGGAERETALYSRREQIVFAAKHVDRSYDRALPALRTIERSDPKALGTVVSVMRFDGLTSSRKHLSEYDGMFRPVSRSLDLLAEAIDRIRFTPETLERYAGCPARFFFDDVLNLREEPAYHPDLSDAGRILRAVLAEYTERAAGEEAVPADAEAFIEDAVERHYRAVLDENEEDAFSSRLRRSLLSGLEKASEGSNERRGVLATFLDYERNAPDFLRPYAANLAGTVSLEPGPRVHVTVDRVDRTIGKEALVAYRYTTGTLGNAAAIAGGLRFDLPLAVVFLQEYAARRRIALPAGGAGVYLVRSARELRRGGYFARADLRAARRDATSEDQPIFSGRREGFTEQNAFENIIEQVKARATALYRLMQTGVFHFSLGSSAERECRECAFRRICRRDALRAERLAANLRGTGGVNVTDAIG